MYKLSKWLVLTLLLPTLAIAGFGDEEGGDGDGGDGGDVTVVIDVDNGGGSGGGGGGSGQSASLNFPDPIYVSDSASALTSGADTFDNNILSIVSGLDAKLKDSSVGFSGFTTVNGVYALVVPTVEKKAIVEKTVALGVPAGFYVSEKAFKPGSNTLTAEGIKFFDSITLQDGDLAVILGSSAKATVVAAVLAARGINSDQILSVPDVKLKDPNTVAVYVIGLPTMENLFEPLNTTGN
ncbi:MAG: hypothetical protein K5Q00_03665 [Gammaproteobacteria bacterium]|nr:hypothetical protein [Gammaproteobacteria bacterium]